MTTAPDPITSRWRPDDDAIVIGIGGGSGSGKSTIAAALADGLRPLSVRIIGLDRFFKEPSAMPTYESGRFGEPRPDFNHPESIDRSRMAEGCRPPFGVDVVIIEGILALHYDELRKAMHLRLYVTIELEEMLRRRTERNLAAGYGGGLSEIEAYNRECVVPRHRQYNAPTARFADRLIPNDTGSIEQRNRIIADIAADMTANTAATIPRLRRPTKGID